jgi:hypothetical protein
MSTLSERGDLRLISRMGTFGWRVAHGGHNVPESMLRRRFPRSLQLLLHACAPAVEHALCNMNGGPDPAPGFSQSGAERSILDPQRYAQLLDQAR